MTQGMMVWDEAVSAFKTLAISLASDKAPWPP